MATKKKPPDKATIKKAIKGIQNAFEWESIIRDAGLFDLANNRLTPWFFSIDEPNAGRMVCIYDADRLIGYITQELFKRLTSLCGPTKKVKRGNKWVTVQTTAKDERDAVIRIAKERGLDLSVKRYEDIPKIEALGLQLQIERQELWKRYHGELWQRLHEHIPQVLASAMKEISGEVFNLILQDVNGKVGFTTDDIEAHQLRLIRDSTARKAKRMNRDGSVRRGGFTLAEIQEKIDDAVASYAQAQVADGQKPEKFRVTNFVKHWPDRTIQRSNLYRLIVGRTEWNAVKRAYSKRCRELRRA